MDECDVARANLELLRKNPYPGRGLVEGLTEDGKHLVQACWIMGRSPNSRNRVFGQDGCGRIFTEAADPKEMKDPSLIIYNAMRERAFHYVVSNGEQTDQILNAMLLKGPQTFRSQEWEYEPDAPHFTPRISATFWREHAEIAIARRFRSSAHCERSFYSLPLPRGIGYCVTTYEGDGNPLPSFRGEPYPLPLGYSIDGVARTLWEALNPDNRVAIAVKFIEHDSGQSMVQIINKYEKVA
jgi:IMP cyclohydrolase